MATLVRYEVNGKIFTSYSDALIEKERTNKPLTRKYEKVDESRPLTAEDIRLRDLRWAKIKEEAERKRGKQYGI